LCQEIKLKLIAAISLVLCLSACEDPSQIRSLGTMERERIQLSADTNEPITRVLVREGDSVDIDTVLVQQDQTRAEIALIKARAAAAAALSTLSEAEAGPRSQEISQARARLRAAKSASKTARSEFERDLKLIETNLISENARELSQGKYDEAAARLSEAEAALEELLEGTRSETIDQARAMHAAAVANAEDLVVALNRTTVRAPIAGVIEALPFRIGERPPVGATVAVMLASGRTYARVHVSEPLRVTLAVGAAADVWMDGRELPIAGQLRWISADAAFTPYFALNQNDRSRLSYVAEIDVVDESNNLPVGVPVEVSFPGLTGE
jgi:HlyD family secretion protein